MQDVKIKNLKTSDEVINYALRVFLKQSMICIFGFFFATASFEELSPFGISFVAGTFLEYIPIAVLGTALGFFQVYGISVVALRYIASSIVAGITAYVFKRSMKSAYHKHFSMIAGFFSLFSTGIIMSLSVALSADEIIIYMAEGIMGGAVARFTDKFFSIPPSKRNIARFSGEETASVFVLFAVLLLSLNNFSFYIFSPAVIAGIYAVLVSASFGGDKYGAVSGIVAGVMLGIGSMNSYLTGGISLGGLLCGLFGRYNRFISAVIFLITVSLGAFVSDDWVSASHVIYNVGIATTLFLFTPKKIARIYRRFFIVSDEKIFLSGQNGVLKNRLKIAADSMNDVTSSVKAVAGIYRRRSTPRERDVYDNVCVKICKECRNYDACWNKNSQETVDWFLSISDVLKYGGELSEVELPHRFLNVCVSPDKVMKALFYEITCYKEAMREAAKTGETVNIVSDQFGSVSMLLSSLAQTMDYDEDFEYEKTQKVYEALSADLKLDIRSCGVFRNTDEHIFCELSFRAEENGIIRKITDVVSAVLDLQTEEPVYSKNGDNVYNLTVCEKTKFSVLSGGCQINSGDNKWCGDTFESFYDGKGNFYVVLSDGMGTGKKAAADSVMCCSLTSLLLKAGYPVTGIIKMINSAMLVRSGEESLATLDIAVVNLYSGEVCFYKAGAAASIAMKHFKLLKIEKPSLPVGILADIDFEKIEIKLSDSDSFVLMSDGVSENAVSMWREILKDSADYNGKQLADKLAKTAHMNSENDNADDITVVAVAINNNLTNE